MSGHHTVVLTFERRCQVAETVVENSRRDVPQERRLHPHSVRREIAALRFFCVKTLRRRYIVDDTPYPKVPRRLPTVLTPEEVQRLIASVRTLTERAMLMLLYSTGMRNAELRHLQVRDIDSRAMLIHVSHAKGGRDRYVPLSPTLLATFLTTGFGSRLSTSA
jgi:integrase/recombinase XerD